VSSTIDTVSAQSANWGGSALALSAGPGVSLTKSGNTLIAGLDETVLWSNASGSSSIALSEPITNFERCRFKMKSDQGNHYDFAGKLVGNVIVLFFTHGDANAWSTWMVLDYDTSTDTITVRHTKSLGHSFTSNSTTLSGAVDSYKDAIVEVVGINRTAGV
jgi:hypothetical protein